MSKRNPMLRAVLAGALAAATLAACGRGRPGDVPTIPFEKYQLQNGLTVILSEDHRLPLVAVDIWYHVGPANEAAGRTGFAHLFEHMMFQGSKHVPGDSHFQLLESAGASTVNGTTGFDRTNYFETLPASELELGLWLESDRMGYLLDAVDELKLANQQAVVRNERRQSIENRPYGIANDALFRLVFPPGHPYAANVMGSHADIQAAKLDDVKAFFKQYYAPNNASLVIAGDFDPAAAKQMVERYFGPLKRGPDVPPVQVTTPPITAERRAIINDRIQLPRVYMAWITPAFFKPGDAEADIVAGILGGGTSSRLYKSLVYEQQIAQDVSTFQVSMALGSMFQIVATVRPGHTPAEVEAAIDGELEAFRRDGPSDAEVSRAANLFETERLAELESIGGFGGVADTLNMFNHYVGDPGYLGTYLANHRKVSRTDAREFAASYLGSNARAVLHVVPGTPDLGEPVPTPPMPRVAPGTGAEAVNADAPWRMTRPPAAAAHALSLPPAKSFTLANGLTVVYQVRKEAPVASVGLVLRTGGDANPPDRPGLANFVVTLLGQGTTTRSALQIADEFAQNGSSLELSSTKDSTWVSTTALPRNLESVLDLVADVALHPAFAPEELERQRASRLAEIAAAEQNPNTVAARVANLALYGPTHPYGYIELGTPDSIKIVTRDDVLALWKRTYVPVNAALVVNSPFDEDRLRPLVERALGSWATAAAPQVNVLGIRPAGSRVIVVDTPGAPQTQVIVAGIGAARDVPEYPSLEVMNALLGGLFSSRINLNLREVHGYTYGAGSQFIYRKYPGPFWVSTAVRTDATADAIAQIFDEIERMGESPVSANELTMGRDAIVRSLPDTFETGARTIGALGDLFVYRLGLDYYTRLPDAVAAVSADSVLAAARQYLHTDGLIVVAVGDRKAIEPGLRNLKLGKVDVWK